MLAYKFRLYPNHEEELRLLRAMELCRRAYNRMLEEFNENHLSSNEMGRFLTRLKKEWPELNEVYSKCLQPECNRLYANLASLRELKKRGRKVGKLRFKPSQRFRTITYNQSGFRLLPKNDKFGLLHLSKIGDIPMRMHRAVEGEIKGVTVKHMPSGKWFACLLVDDGRDPRDLTIIDSAIGIDVGLEHYTVDSDGNEAENPRYLKRELKKLRREQRHLSKKQKGSKNHVKQRMIVARTYERVCDQLNDYQHKLSRHYVDNYDLIVTEELDIEELVESGHLSRSISDASWSSFNQKLAYKAVRAGKLFVQVDPRGTSQTCPMCYRVEVKTISQRTHDCPCGYKDTRDHASSLVILDRGLRKVRSERSELTLLDIRPLQPSSSGMQAEWMKKEAPPVRAG